jgi:hypothetical protein
MVELRRAHGDTDSTTDLLRNANDAAGVTCEQANAPTARGAHGRGVYTSRARVAPEEALTAWQALHPWRVTYIVAQHRRMEGLAGKDDRGSGLAMTAPAQAMAEPVPGNTSLIGK